ncbi:MAG: DNA/RNA non-specific endonuclease [Pyrinomonadaceae bacterium]|nr:DNA/RNA non-specific endonuclease [Pyrinomonadaceae bacterium]
MNKKVINGGIIALIIIIVLIAACVWVSKKIWQTATDRTETTETTQPESPRTPNTPILNVEQAQKIYLAPGNPSNATGSPANADNYLMVNNAYALSYNNSRGSANWVAWRITASDFGVAERQNDFRPDPNLPKNFARITPADYTGSGFDRGHLCPSADRSSSPETNSETFYMTNMTPQTPDLNRNVWNDFETYSRDLVKKSRVDLYVVAGCYGEKGKLKKKVSVPTNCWKVIIAIPSGADFSAVNETTPVTAIDMPNIAYPGKTDWRKFRTTVRAIEQKTNLNLLSNLPQNLQETLENRVDNK